MSIGLFSSFIKEPPKTSFDGEDPDEKVLYVLRRAFITNLWWVALVIFLGAMPVFIGAFLLVLEGQFPGFASPQLSFNITAFWYLFLFGFAFERFLNWYFNVYIITDHRIIDMDYYSLFARSVAVAPLRNIEDISYKVSGFFGSFFNIGDIIIQTAAERPQFEFEMVSNPSRVHDILSDLVKEVRRVIR